MIIEFLFNVDHHFISYPSIYPDSGKRGEGDKEKIFFYRNADAKYSKQDKPEEHKGDMLLQPFSLPISSLFFFTEYPGF